MKHRHLLRLRGMVGAHIITAVVGLRNLVGTCCMLLLKRTVVFLVVSLLARREGAWLQLVICPFLRRKQCVKVSTLTLLTFRKQTPRNLT